MDTPPELTPADLTPLDPAYRTVLRIVAGIWSAVFLVGALVAEFAVPGWNGVFAEFTAVSVLSQVVAGTNYFVKVKTGGDFAHVRIYQPLPHTGAPAELVAVRPGLKDEDELAYFEGN